MTKKTVLGGFAVILLGLTVIATVLLRLFTPHDAILFAQNSADDRYIATVIVRNVDATTNYATLVTLQDTSALFSFNTDTVLAIDGKTDIDVHWTKANTLYICCPEAYFQRKTPADAEIRQIKPSWHDVTIDYTTADDL